MNLFKKISILAGLALAICALSWAPLATAHEGEHEETDSTSQTENSTKHAPDDDGTTHRTREREKRGADSTSSEQQIAQDTSHKEDTLRSRAKQLLEDRRQDRKARTKAQLQQACEAHRAAVTKRLDKVDTRAQKHLEAMNKLFAKVQTYQQEHQLSVSNYTTLLADTTAKQTAATTAVAVLQAQTGSFDCSLEDPAAQLAAGKTALDDARSALQSYRSSLKALITALLDAKRTTEGSNQ